MKIAFFVFFSVLFFASCKKQKAIARRSKWFFKWVELFSTNCKLWSVFYAASCVATIDNCCVRLGRINSRNAIGHLQGDVYNCEYSLRSTNQVFLHSKRSQMVAVRVAITSQRDKDSSKHNPKLETRNSNRHRHSKLFQMVYCVFIEQVYVLFEI